MESQTLVAQSKIQRSIFREGLTAQETQRSEAVTAYMYGIQRESRTDEAETDFIETKTMGFPFATDACTR
jgi:hypothetical protein